MCVNGAVLDRGAADWFVEELDLDDVPVCPACLLELAWKIRDGRPLHPSTLGRVVSWVWPEIEDAVRAAAVRARMREVDGAEAALGDLAARGERSPLARAVVERLAERLARELA